MRPPARMRWLFWNVDFDAIDVQRDADLVLARVLERGRLVDVRWALRQYGSAGIRRFFRRGPHAEVSPKTVNFWRVVLDAKEETWPELPAFRRNSSAPWID